MCRVSSLADVAAAATVAADAAAAAAVAADAAATLLLRRVKGI